MPPFKLKIALKDAHVKIERVVLIREDINMLQLHLIIQEAMGWDYGHLFEFQDNLSGRIQMRVGVPFDDGFGDSDTLWADKVRLLSVGQEFPKGFWYIYDFGDDWAHRISFQKLTAKDTQMLENNKGICFCVEAVGACPPEDCGGVWGYANLIKAVNDKKHPEHDHFCEWMGLDEGDVFDPNDVDLEDINVNLKDLAKRSDWKMKAKKMFER
jgi:hypothetical protein